MRTVLTAAAVLGLLSAAPAMAQSSSAAPATPPTMSSSQMAPGALQKDVMSDLEKAGFTDVHVMPSSFLVHAKDQKGRAVVMVINPDSVTEVTTMAKPAKK